MGANDDSWVAELNRLVKVAVAERPVPIGQDGIVVPGSYKPSQGTVDVLLAKTAAIAPTPDEGPLVIPNVSLMTPVHGQQAGPVGGERVLLFPVDTGYRGVIEHWSDDSPQAPAGECWYVHRDPNTGTANASSKFTNDGANTGDGKGGYQLLVGGYAKIVTTGGITLTLNDTTNQVEIAMPGGLTLILDNATNTLQIGGSGTTPGDAIVRQSDLQNALTSFASAILTWANQNYQHGTGTAVSGPTAPTATASQKSFTA